MISENGGAALLIEADRRAQAGGHGNPVPPAALALGSFMRFGRTNLRKGDATSSQSSSDKAVPHPLARRATGRFGPKRVRDRRTMFLEGSERLFQGL